MGRGSTTPGCDTTFVEPTPAEDEVQCQGLRVRLEGETCADECTCVRHHSVQCSALPNRGRGGSLPPVVHDTATSPLFPHKDLPGRLCLGSSGPALGHPPNFPVTTHVPECYGVPPTLLLPSPLLADNPGTRPRCSVGASDCPPVPLVRLGPVTKKG